MILDDLKSQEKAKEYVLNRTITRPKTNVWSLVLLFGKMFVFAVFFFIIVSLIVNHFFVLNLTKSIIVFLECQVIVFLFLLKKIAIVCVECYQHYASDDCRRMCLCEPTCSEYAILVLRKYSFIKALYLIYIRLTKTCKNTYKIDYP